MAFIPVEMLGIPLSSSSCFNDASSGSGFGIRRRL